MGRGSVSLKKMDQNRDFGVTQNNEHRIKIYSNLTMVDKRTDEQEDCWSYTKIP